MLAALLIALAYGAAVTVYAIRGSAEHTRLAREVQIWRDSACGSTILYGNEFSLDSARRREARAVSLIDNLKRKPRRRK